MNSGEKDPLLAMLDMLERPIAFHRVFAMVGGGAVEGLLLSQAFYWSKTPTAKERDGWFYHCHAEWEEETALTRREQQTARKHLREKKLLEERIGVLPGEGRVVWFRVNREELCRALKALQATAGSHKRAGRVAPKRPTPLHESARPVAPKRPTPPINAETTTETTQRLHTHTARSAPAPASAPSSSASVCVSGSRFTLQQVRAWAEHQKANGAKIDPYAVALRRCEDGKADDDIEAWLAAGMLTQKIVPRDTSACPDCHGEGYFFVNPADPKTHRRCNHLMLAQKGGNAPTTPVREATA